MVLARLEAEDIAPYCASTLLADMREARLCLYSLVTPSSFLTIPFNGLKVDSEKVELVFRKMIIEKAMSRYLRGMARGGTRSCDSTSGGDVS